MNPHQPKVYADYPALVKGDALELLARQATEFPEFLESLSHKAGYAYAPGKWTIAEMAGHIIDTERILIYRLTAVIRGEQSPLPGFDEDEYVLRAHFPDRSLQSFAEEFNLMRRANLFLFRSLSEEELNRTGVASGKEISARRLMLTIAGHLLHHIAIIHERYL
ncbi:DinB superfamily protein [Pedobacter westerhofensis]|uniref:DinB superfamily protein n=1 Tax=Pedobacter westerhofensis TaxID=425512 RepID=A0A521DY54_9SPHI|nr:DinB family protein [Pedobacter westerhofensis]SMO76011.1 DinB superfamily protein [Pedobacter westerhofensis]